MGKNNIGVKKCRTIFLWVLNFGEVGELTQEFSKSHCYGDFFEKYSLKCDFGKILQEISLEKMKKIFLVRFSCKIEGDF